jgi:hypothetical protein
MVEIAELQYQIQTDVTGRSDNILKLAIELVAWSTNENLERGGLGW